MKIESINVLLQQTNAVPFIGLKTFIDIWEPTINGIDDLKWWIKDNAEFMLLILQSSLDFD